MRKVEYSELNTTPELLTKIEVGSFNFDTVISNLDFGHVTYHSLSAEQGVINECSGGSLIQLPKLVPEVIKHNGKLFFKFNFEHGLEKFDHSIALLNIALYESFTAKHNTIIGYTENVYKEWKARLYEHNGLVNISNYIRAMSWLLDFTLETENRVLKVVNTAFNALSKQILYVYKTHTDIENHYFALKREQKLVSCMTKKRLKNTHFISADTKLCENANFTILDEHKSVKRSKVFTPNVASYNNIDTTALALFSFKSPDELAESETYGFLGRAVISKKPSGKWEFVRFYGSELISSILGNGNDTLVKTDNLLGLKVRAYVYNVKERKVLLPYIDGSIRRFCLVSNKLEYDDIGRPFMWATVGYAGTKSDTYPKHNVFELSTTNWTAERVRWGGFCALTRAYCADENLVVVEDGEEFRYIDKALYADGMTVAGIDKLISTINKRVEARVSNTNDTSTLSTIITCLTYIPVPMALVDGLSADTVSTAFREWDAAVNKALYKSSISNDYDRTELAVTVRMLLSIAVRDYIGGEALSHCLDIFRQAFSDERLGYSWTDVARELADNLTDIILKHLHN